MAGIPLHTASPINLNATTGYAATPTTTAAPTRTSLPSSVAASTTAYTMNSTQSAQPGAAPVPTPTSSLQYHPTTPPPPTRTTATPPRGTRSSPPPPQPGQAPSPKSSPRRGSTKRPSYPEPPQPNAVPQTNLPSLQTITNPRPTNYPPPSPRIYEPTRSIPPASITSIASPNQITSPLDLSHPPGYRQNHSASFDDRPIEEMDPLHHNKSHNSSPSRGGKGRGIGILDTDPYETHANGGNGGGSENGDESPIWEGVKSAVDWAKAAGKRLSVQAEEQWKIVTGDE